MKKKIDPKKMIAAYRMHGSLKKAASVLGISFWKARNLMKKSGYLMKARGGSSHKGKHKKKPRRGSFAIWLREHPEIKLPLNLQEIAKITGCSSNAIKCSLYRLRKKGKKIPLLRKRRKI